MTRLPRPDSALLERTASGDRRAWEELGGRYTLSVYAQVFALVRTPPGKKPSSGRGVQRASLPCRRTSTPPAWLVGLARSILLARAPSTLPA